VTQDDTAVRVLLEGEFSSMGSAWTEYLCLCRDGDRVVLSSCGYEVLADIYSFEVEDDDGNVEHELPDTIDGKAVVGIEDGEYVIGGDLVPHDDDAEITLGSGEIEEARKWLEGREWHLKPGYEGAWKEIERALGKRGGTE
jgi:hypothetical protein